MSLTILQDAQSSLAPWLKYLECLHPRSIELDLNRVSTVANRLRLGLECVVKIVVGGTNGKGSTCAMLEAVILAAGYKVGLYTSPHLIQFNERVRINGQKASDDSLVNQFVAVQAARGNVSLTYFEFTTLAILLLFSQSALDVVILEVGLGGRLDAVNIIDADCAIVTNVDLDHTEWLGSTREEIGSEKAHIFRPGKPAIFGDPKPPRSVINHAKAIGADLWLFGRDFNYSDYANLQRWAFVGRDENHYSALAYPSLCGANQLLNASAALAALESLQDRLIIPRKAVRLGLLNIELLGRFQLLSEQPAVILDVAHNPQAAAVLSKNLDHLKCCAKTYAVFGMLSDKDAIGVIAKLGLRIAHWYCASLPGPRGLTAQVLADRINAVWPGAATAYTDPATAFFSALQKASKNDRIVVFGSFMTVSLVLQTVGQ